MFKIGGEFDDDDGEYGTDYDPNDVDPEKNPEISKDNDQDHDPFECPDYDNKDPDYDPFKCPDYDNKDPDYDPFKCPDYDNKDPDYDPFKCPDYDNEGENSPSALNSEMDDNPDNELDDPIKEYESESEPEKQPEGINNPSNSGTVSVIEPEQKPEHESEEKPEEFEVVTPEGEPERPGESPEVMEIRADLEEWGHEPEYESEMEPESEYEQEPEKIPEQELETDPGQEQEEQVAQEEFKRDKEGNIVLDAEQMELFGSRVSSQEEMEVEILEEELEELFDSYEEQGLEHDRGLETSTELEQESSQEQLELEQEAQGFNRQQQEEKVNQEMERAQEQELSQELSEKSQAEVSHTSKKINAKSMEIIREKDEIENVQESSRKKIQEIEQELVWEKEQSQEQSQEIEQESIREIHQNIEVIQEEIQEQIEEQTEPPLRESDKFFEAQYKQETGRRPIYAGKETRGFIEWKEHLNEKEEKQEEKNKLLQEKEKEIKKQSKEIRESKEEWAQYLANSIKGAEFPENIKVELNELLEKYEDLRKLLEKLKNREIAEEEFEKEVKEFEHILIEKRHIARPLFMNFDWFRRYFNGMIRKAGKRVAHLYISKKTREFLSYLSGRIEQLNNIGNSHENAEKFKEFLEKSFQIKEKWALLLNNLIHETPNKEISTGVKEELGAVIKRYCKIRAILSNKNILEEDKEKLIQERIEKCNPRFFKLFEILKRFLGAYDNYSRKWMEQSLIIEGKTTVRRLSQKLENIKKENAIHQILNETISSVQNFKEILKENLYRNITLSLNEKSTIIKIIRKDKLSEDKDKLISVLSKLPTKDLISLLGEDFKQYSQTYVKNRYQFNEIKRILISDFLDKKIIEQNKEDSDFTQYIKLDEESKINRLKKHGETVKILITKDELALKGYNYVRQEILRKSKEDDIYLMILKYADIVLERIIELNKFPFYKKTFIRKTIQLKIIDLFGGKDYITKEDKFFELVKKYREYKALIYEIRCKTQFPDAQFQNRGYYGYTRSTEEIRLINHATEAVEQYINYLKGYRDNPPTKLNRVIIIALKDMGYSIEDLHLSLQTSNMKEQIKLLKKITQRLNTDYFDVIVLEFHKNLETAVKREIQLIAEHNYISIGLNERGGGQGGLPYIFLPLYDIAGMIALGCTQKKIFKILNKLYSYDFMNLKIGENTLRRRIIEECKNWVNAQRLFLKPVVEALVYIGFSDKKIYNTLSSPHSKEGWIYKWWKKGKKLDFEFWIDSRELDISNKNERLLNPEVKFCDIPKSKWEEWAIKEIPNNKIAEISELPFNTIVSVYKHNFGGRNKILLNYRRDKTITMRKKGISLKNIYTFIFKKPYYPSNFKRDFKSWFNGMTPEQIEEEWGPEEV